MSAPKHTQGPWEIDRDTRPGMQWNNHIVQSANRDHAICFMAHTQRDGNAEGRANARRIVACVNACEGLTTEALEQGQSTTVRAAMAGPVQWDYDAALEAALRLPPKSSIFHEMLEQIADDPTCGPVYRIRPQGRCLLDELQTAYFAKRAPLDPMDWPLPCDVTVGHGTMRKGVKLGTLVRRMKVLYEMATGHSADEVANRTPEQRGALLSGFQAKVGEPIAEKYLCKAWGETDIPVAAIVFGLEGVSAFLVEQWLGSSDHQHDDGTQALPAALADMQAEWDVEGDAWVWSVEFEAGGISVQKVFDTKPATPAAPVAIDLRAFGEARFGVFHEDGRFEAMPEGVAPGEWTAQHPRGHTARWVGGRADMELLRAALAAGAGNAPKMQILQWSGNVGKTWAMEKARYCRKCFEREYMGQPQPAQPQMNELVVALEWTAAALQAVANDADRIRRTDTGEVRSVARVLGLADKVLGNKHCTDLGVRA